MKRKRTDTIVPTSSEFGEQFDYVDLVGNQFRLVHDSNARQQLLSRSSDTLLWMKFPRWRAGELPRWPRPNERVLLYDRETQRVHEGMVEESQVLPNRKTGYLVLRSLTVASASRHLEQFEQYLDAEHRPKLDKDSLLRF